VGGYYGGGYYGSGTYVDGFYRTVYNPPPGTYDPIFGVYNPGEPYPDAAAFAPQGATPTVVINQNFQPDTVRPQFRDYTDVALPEARGTQTAPGGTTLSNATADAAANLNAPASAVRAPVPVAGEQQIYFLIALKDSTIEAAIAYWVDGATLHFVNLQGRQDSVPLDQVDRDMSKRLNQGRRIGFGLPGQ